MKVITRLGAADQQAFDRVAAAELPGLQRVLPGLSKIADHSVLWFATAAALNAGGRPRLRRAALRGVLAIGVASPLANLVGKQIFRRQRPFLALVPAVRRRHRIPTSPAFPSGHSASAAAFATAVAMEAPRKVSLPVAVVAGAVAFSRIYTGAHYPGDVAAGVALGTVAGLATRLVWPTLPGPAHVVKVRSVESWLDEHPDAAKGEGLVVVLNAKAGSGSRPLLGGPSIPELVAAELPAAEVVQAGPDDDITRLLDSAAKRARALAVAGGDGSVNTAAQIALDHGLPLLVIPAGTLDHFARALGLETPADAIAAYTRGSLARVDVGCLGLGDGSSTVFLNNAALGVYPELVERRERLERRLGKWPALAVAAAQVLRHAEPIEVVMNGRSRRLWLGFVGNCRYGARGTAPNWRARLDDGLLDVRLVVTGRRVPRTRAFVATLLGHLHLGRAYRHWNAVRVKVNAHRPQLLVARDGEIGDLPAPITVTKHPLRLVTFVPGPAPRAVH